MILKVYFKYELLYLHTHFAYTISLFRVYVKEAVVLTFLALTNNVKYFPRNSKGLFFRRMLVRRLFLEWTNFDMPMEGHQLLS